MFNLRIEGIHQQRETYFLSPKKSFINKDDIKMVYLSTYAPSAILHF